MSKETFKMFARSHPELAKEVLNNTTTWQKLFELYEIYGENNSVWDTFLPRTSPSSNTTLTSPATIKDLISMVKNIDLDSVQKGVNNLQKTIGLLQDIGLGSAAKTPDVYEPRPLYQYFED